MKITFEVTIEDSRANFEKVLKDKGASDKEIPKLLSPGSVLSFDDFVDKYRYSMESELTGIES